MNTLQRHFLKQMKRNSKECVIHIKDCSKVIKTTCFLKEINDQNYTGIDKKYLFSDININITQGDIVEVLGEKWLIVQQDQNYNNTYNKYVVRRLSHVIKFKFKDIIYPLDVIIENNESIVDKSKDLDLIGGNMIITCQNNKIVNKLKENYRFIFTRTAYKIIGFTKVEKGLYRLYAQKDILSDKDNIVDEIAYNVIEEKVNTYNIKCPKEINMLAFSRYNLKENIIFKKDNKIDNDPVVEYSSQDIDKIEFLNDKGLFKAKIWGQASITIKYHNITKIIKVNIKDEEKKEIILLDDEGNNTNFEIDNITQKTFTAKYLVNSIYQKNTKFTFNIKNKKDGLSVQLAKIKGTTDDTVTIRANKKNKVGTIILSATTGEETKEFEIRVVNLF